MDQGSRLPERTRTELAETRHIRRTCGCRFSQVKDFKVNVGAVKENSDILKSLQRFSSWYKVKVAVALCLRYKKKLRAKVLAKKKEPSDGASEDTPMNGTSISPGLNVVDLEEAEVQSGK